jgi:hypothetical protein
VQIWSHKKDLEIIQTLEAEIAKANNEISCARRDTEKAQNRLKFAATAIQEMKKRELEN